MMQEPLEISLERDQLKQVVSVDGDTVLIGRGSDCDVRLDDPLASRRHCRLERLGEEVFLVDLGSANGTWIDGQQVDRRPLTAQDLIRIGGTTLQLSGGLAERLAAMESTRTQETPQEEDTLRTLLAVARTLDQEDRVERVAALLVDAAVSLCRAERGFLFLLEDGAVSLAVARNFAREPVTAPESKFSRTLLETAAKAKAPVLLRDAASDGEFAGVESISDLGLRSVLAVPLRFRGQLLGLLAVDHRMTAAAFRQRDAELLGGLAGMAASHLGATLEAQMRGRMQRRLNRLERQLGRRSEAPQATLDTAGGGGFHGLHGASPAMTELYAQMERILDSEVPVVIEGESGTGKELVARALHLHGRQADAPFVIENCGALPDTLLESELFGHVKGAFTGATRDRKGRFEEADGGIMFLDEVAEMSEAMQARLLRVLQEGEIRRVGSNEVRRVQVRVIAASNVSLAERVAEGRFREDLFYRLKVVSLQLPPLRERAGDVRLLTEHFLAVEAADQGRETRSLGAAALERLEAYAWPGNVRQLRNEMRRLTLLGEGEVQVEELSAGLREGDAAAPVVDDADLPLGERVKALEVAAIHAALQQEPNNRSRAAKLLGITRFTLLRKIEKYGLGPAADGPDTEEPPA